MHPTTPLGFDWWTASVTLDPEGSWTFRVEGWSDPWETWVHNAEIKIPAGIDVDAGLYRGQGAVHRRGRAGHERPRTPQTAALLRGAAKSLDSGQQVEDRLEVVLADDVRGAMASYGPRELVSPSPDYPIYRRPEGAALFSSWYEFFPRSQGAEYDEADPDAGPPAPSTPRTSGWRRRPRWASTWSTSRRSTPSARTFRKGPNNTLHRRAQRPGLAVGHRQPKRAATTPSIPTWVTSTPSTASWPRPGRSAWRSRWTSRCRPRRTIRG